MTVEQLDRGKVILSEIQSVKARLSELELAKNWENCGLGGCLTVRDHNHRVTNILIDNGCTVLMFIDMLHDKYTTKLKELEKEFENL